MDKWILYGKSGNPSVDTSKAFLQNHGIPFENRSIYQLTYEEIKKMAAIVSGGAKSITYPTAFSYSLINPQRSSDAELINEIQHGNMSEEEIINCLAMHPYLVITPIITNFQEIIIGYQYQKMMDTFRFVKVKDVTMA
ncbi:hypothetical protein ACE1TI_08420 [Alteribacillus sp. JSM 102045]|uniref:hypothetical protein n=1 Tax=Alteribacillus sp. JSM 102045 TaxID=1562101 RepID=UPI0035C09291